jgi:hypothetical protein
LLICWLTRVTALDQFPPFLDEGVHLHYVTQLTTLGPFAYVGEGRLFTLWYYRSFSADQSGGVLALRVVTALAILPGVAGCIAIGRALAGRIGLLMAGIAAVFSAYHWFFDRLALGDSLAGAAVLVGVSVALRLRRRVRWTDAALTGAIIFLAIGLKLSVLPFAALPVLAALTCWSRGRHWTANLRWGVIGTGALIVPLGGLALVARLRGYDLFGLLTTHNPGNTAPLLERWITNVGGTMEALAAYLGLLLLILLLCAVAYLFWRRAWFLVAALLLPTMVIWANTSQFTRFFYVPFALLNLCGVVALALVVQRRSVAVQRGAVIAVVVVGAWQALPFWTALAQDPATLPLARRDRWEYIASEASGFGLAELSAALREAGAVRVVGVFANCWNFQYRERAQFVIECPVISPDGSSVAALSQLLRERREAGTFAVLEDVPYSLPDAPGALYKTILRLDDGPRLRLYDLSPTP